VDISIKDDVTVILLLGVSFMVKHELTFWLCAGKWLVPPKPSAKKPFWQKMGEMLPHHFTANYWRNNREVATMIYHNKRTGVKSPLD
jgi:hypothetical protein